MKVFLDTIGCRLNQGEIETYARQFRAAGYTLVGDPGEADLVVINTCAVTAAAESDSRQKIRQAARAGAKEIIATGCWSTLNPKVTTALPGVTRVVHNDRKDHLVADLLQIPLDEFELEPLEREPLPGVRGRTRAFIKVQDGCDNRCTFCVTTLARGQGRSRHIYAVIEDVQAALRGETSGAKEIVLTGVHLGSWGKDFRTPLHLKDLIEAILKNTDTPRLRLSSLEPWDIDDRFFDLWENSRLCRHLHLPLQSGSAGTLRRMARKGSPASFRKLASSARASIPGLAITTDIITGFPGEDQHEFSESLEFVDEMQFAGGHAFTYSARPGTAAALMPGQVPHHIRKERNAHIRAVLAASGDEFRKGFIGNEAAVLWENATAMGPETWSMNGLTDNNLRVYAQAPRHLWNQITTVRLTRVREEGLEGKIKY
jgi:threonylcarbamoyladenosine tRNA methylthiotransferase MtaB